MVMDKNNIFANLGKLSIRILFAKMYLPEFEKKLLEYKIYITDYSLDIYDDYIAIAGVFKKEIPEALLPEIHQYMINTFKYSTTMLRNFAFTIKIY